MIKCKTCGADIAKSARRCPHCGAYIWTYGRIGCGLILLFFAAVMINSFCSGPDQKKTTTWTPEQKKSAGEFQQTLMDTGMVTQFKGDGKIQVVYVNRQIWAPGSYEDKKKILKTMSETNEILGRTPWVEIRDNSTGEVYGALKPPLTIEIYK